jgi:hypothetical protein
VLKSRNKQWKNTVSHVREDKCIQNLDQNMWREANNQKL